ncbi:hypothetical protein DV737_g1357, partial [Chaetothyriales sp. CBS 132003]
MSLLDIDRTPLRRLTAVFVAWKLVIALIAIAAPGPGYDTSSTFLHLSPRSVSARLASSTSHTPDLLAKFVRWDAIYFTQIAQRGYVFEQEWAFGVGLSTTLRWLTQRLFLNRRPELYQIAVTGVLLSHGMHYLSTILTYYIASIIVGFPTKTRRGASSASSVQSRVPALAALLYILSPAGIILSAPYTEALFAFRNLLGLLVYLVALRSPPTSSTTKALLTIISGLILSTATAVRSNGILSGMPFLLAFLAQLYHATTSVLHNHHLPPTSAILNLGSLLIAGLLIAAGQMLPQVPAYRQFCISSSSSSPPRPWCSYTIPSIFTFAQSEYWNVGLFNYWTAGNIPLFALAAPAITLLAYSSYSGLQQVLSRRSNISRIALVCNDTSGIVTLALPQLVLAIAALFAFHVQIITRIASGYPWWYIWVAKWIVDDEEEKRQNK